MMTLASMAIALLVTTTLAICGFVMIITSVKAHWDTSVCAHCGYDVRIQIAQSQTCPECGHKLQQACNGYIERKPVRAWLGVGLIVASLILLALIVAAWFNLLGC
jgi:hypothetical protein